MQFTHGIDSLKGLQYSMKGEECLSPDRDEGSEDISCSSYQKFQRGRGENFKAEGEMLV